MTRRIPLLAALGVASLVLAACGGDAADDAVAEPTVDPTTAIYSLAIDPADGALLVATGPGFFKVPPGASSGERIQPSMTAPEGEGDVKDLVLRFTGPGRILGSGHAGEPTLPTNLGLVSSGDGGKTWEPISGIGKADYHELEVFGDRLFGLRADDRGTIYFSSDDGKTFETRAAPTASPPIDIAINPDDPEHWAVSSDSGTFVSSDGGNSWRQRDTTFGARLAWPDAGTLASIGLDGQVRASADGGKTWEKTGSVGSSPKELVANAAGELYVITTNGSVQRSADRGATWSPIATVR